MATYIPLQSIELNSSASTVVFSNIPSIYTDLRIVINAKSTLASTDSWSAFFNGDITSTTNYSYQFLYTNSGSGSLTANRASNTVSYIGDISGQDSTSGFFGVTTLDILNYANTTGFKNIICRSGVNGGSGSTAAVNMIITNVWRNTSAINNITLRAYTSGSSLVAGSRIDLYAISTASADTPQAFGGTDVFQDSSYVYHVFKSSGAFIPYRNLTTDILVVAGGGGGGQDNGGGGGAGGLLGFSSQSLTANTSYTVTVGAGGIGATGSGGGAGQGANGNDSQFGSLTLVKGGGGAGGQATGGSNGKTGGSGGGAGNGGSGGSATSGQGNVGGSSVNSGPSFPGGGGGGAGTAGANAASNGTTGGGGGQGSSAYSSWGLATGTGDNYLGTVYYAGGGAGAGGPGGNGGYGGGGNGGTFNGTPPMGTPGRTNCGGGGGGSTGLGSAAANSSGGSGIVIVRYAR